MLLPEFETVGDTNLLIGIKARDESGIEQAFRQVDALLATVRRHIEDTEDFFA